MKKKIILTVLIALLTVCILGLITACDEPEPSSTEGLTFTLINNDLEYEVSGYTGSSTDVYIPSTHNDKPVTSIGSYAFFDCDLLTSVVIGDSVTSIGESAFCYCNMLTSVVIGNNVTSIGERSFKDCHRLVEVVNKSPNLTVTKGDPLNNGCVGYYALSVYNSDSGITKSQLIKDRGFIVYSNDREKVLVAYNGTKTALTLPSYITKINQRALSNSSTLTSVEIGRNVTDIGESAFSECRSLLSVKIGRNVKNIGDYAFVFCEKLISIEIPDSVTSLDYSVFNACTSLTNITVGSNNSAYKSIDGNLYSKDGKTLIKYALGKKTETFVVPNEVITLGDMAFSSCAFLTNVVIGDNVESIGYGTFYSCDLLRNVLIGDSVESIGDKAFEYCKLLTNVVIGESVKSIGNFAFRKCELLTSVEIPDSVIEIGVYAFEDCDSLTIYCEAESQPSGWSSSWNSSNRPVNWSSKG
ncbi:MAG: leucine-rich repeat domain-containing protein [Clostridia bacterium]|nr:leucine-rich repeat domain-containing protein [Clostridia bacterium]